MGSIFKKINKKKLIKKIFIIVIIIVIVIMLAVSTYIQTIDDGTYQEDVKGNVPYEMGEMIENAIYTIEQNEDENSSDINAIKMDDGGYSLNVDITSMVEEQVKTLEKEDSNIYRYIGTSEITELMEKFVRAVIVTQYPDLRVSEKIGTEVSEEDGVQGCIIFVRHKEDGSEKKLEYMPYSKFQALIENANSGIEASQIAVMNKFSIDIDGNLIVANREYTETREYTGSYKEDYVPNDPIVDYFQTDNSLGSNLSQVSKQTIFSEKSVNYKMLISRYTMPFEYMWAFLVQGKDVEFSECLADLVLNSTIEIGVYDNLEKSENANITSYNENTWKSTITYKKQTATGSDEVLRSSSVQDEGPDTEHHYTLYYTYSEINTIDIEITKANIWVMIYEASYKYDEGEDSNPGLKEHEDIIRNTDSDEECDESKVKEDFDKMLWLGDAESLDDDWVKQLGNDIDGVTTYIRRYRKTITRTNQHSTVSAQNQKVQTYIKENTEIREKTNKLAVEGDEDYPNFCQLLDSHAVARGNVIQNKTKNPWIFTLLENNDSTVDMVDLTKYLLYLVTNSSYDNIESFDFEAFYTNMYSIDGLYGNSVAEKVWFALLDAGYSKEAAAGVLGNLYQESGIVCNNLQNTYEKSLGMTDEQYTTAVDNGTYSRSSFINDSAGYGLAQWTWWTRKQNLYTMCREAGVSIADEDTQILFLLRELDMSDSYKSWPGSKTLYSAWQNATTPEDAAKYFCDGFEAPGTPVYEVRTEKAREYYDQFYNLEKTTTSTSAAMNTLIAEAIKIANDETIGYSQDLDKRKGPNYYDCSGLIAYLYEKHFGFTTSSFPQTTGNYYKFDSKYNIGTPSQVGTLQPGDVLWKKGHVVLYIGNGQYVAAHTDEKPLADQITVYTDNPSNYTYVYRFYNVGNEINETTSASGQQIIENCKEMLKYMKQTGGWGFKRSTNYKKTWQEVLQIKKGNADYRKGNCAAFVNWAYKMSGLIKNGKTINHPSRKASKTAKTGKAIKAKYQNNTINCTWIVVDKKTKNISGLQAGDVLIWEDTIGIYGGKDSNGNIRYYCNLDGRDGFKKMANGGPYKKTFLDNHKVLCVVRPNG